MRILKYCFVFAIFSILLWFFINNPKDYQVINGQTFGTYYTIKVKTSSEDKLLQKEIKEEFAKINSEMSVFEISSEISEINRLPAGEWIELSPALQSLLKKSYEIYKMSNGAFDPTTGKLVDLWGFGTSGGIQKIPTEDDIKKMLSVTGFNTIKFSNDFSRLRKEYSETSLNLSAIAKGYGVDRIAALLKEQGYKNFIIEIGGEVTAAGKKSDTVKGWNVGVAFPDQNSDHNAFVVTLHNHSAATSGDYRNFFYIDDQKYSHTIDPTTGYPVKNNLISVTVFDKSCMIADGIATAIMSMGEKKAADFIRRHNLAVIMFIKDNNGEITSTVSDAARKLGVQ